MNDHDHIEIETVEQLRAWLEEHHGQSDSMWLVTFKSSVAEKHVPYGALVDELLCFGWVDSQPGMVDDKRSKRRISPRNPKSAWSGINKEKVARLRKEGRMRASGEAVIARAEANGMWTFLDDVEEGIIPADLGDALDGYPYARQHFEAFPQSAKRAILEWIKQAKKDDTRKKRIEETARLAARNERANQFRAG